MKRLIIGAAALLAACGQSSTEEAEPVAAAPQTLFEQAQAMSPTDSAVLAYTLFWARKDTLERECVGVRETVERGVIPDTVTEESVYYPYIGSIVYAIQCGDLRLTGPSSFRDRYMLIVSPDSDEPQIAACITEAGTDGCTQIVSGRTNSQVEE